jgi:hypothetical protein
MRHVKNIDSGCPFCGASVVAIAQPLAPRLASRSARLLGAAAMAVATGACASAQPVYGAPVPQDSGVVDAGKDGSSLPDAAEFDAIAPMYGGPIPLDAGVDAAKDSGGVAPAYGAPPNP